MANPNVQLAYEALGAYERGDEETQRRLMDPEREPYGPPGKVDDAFLVAPVHDASVEDALEAAKTLAESG